MKVSSKNPVAIESFLILSIPASSLMLVDFIKLLKNTPGWSSSKYVQSLSSDNRKTLADRSQEENNTKWTKLQTSGFPPPVRSGHSALQVSNTMYIFGGYNEGTCHDDLYSFDLIRHIWQKIDLPTTNDVLPDGRASHSWCASSDQKSLYLFGGSGPQWGQTNMGKLLRFDLLTQMWHIVETVGGQHPPPGYGQTMCSIGSRLFLFGGTTGHIYVNALFVFDIPTSTWKKVEGTGQVPSPRYKHQVVASQGHMYLFGGGLYDPPAGNIEVYQLNVQSFEWTRITGPKIAEQDDDVFIPAARLAHSCVKYEEDKIVMFGGRNALGARLNDCSVFNVNTHTWVAMGYEQNQPDPRDFHTAVMSQDQMFIFGGSNGYERNNHVCRYTFRFQPSTLSLLAIQAIKANQRTSKSIRSHMRYLPEELRHSIDQINPHVGSSVNIVWS